MINEEQQPEYEQQVTEIEYAERPNKTALKRDLRKLQQLSQQLIELPEEKLRQFPLSENTIASILESRRIKSMNAMQRHTRYLAKQLFKEDTQAVVDYFNQFEAVQTRNSELFHQLERWRDRLLSEGNPVLEEIIKKYPKIDRQHLRTLMRQANKEAEKNQTPKSARKIFKYLREISENALN